MYSFQPKHSYTLFTIFYTLPIRAGWNTKKKQNIYILQADTYHTSHTSIFLSSCTWSGRLVSTSLLFRFPFLWSISVSPSVPVVVILSVGAVPVCCPAELLNCIDCMTCCGVANFVRRMDNFHFFHCISCHFFHCISCTDTANIFHCLSCRTL